MPFATWFRATPTQTASLSAVMARLARLGSLRLG